MKKILIVEDVDFNRDLLVQLLEEEYKLVEAVDGREGLEKARSEQPDLILMDITIPEISGYDLAPLIRQSEGLGDVPIIAVTAHAMAGDEEKVMAAGCSAYISKPIDEDLLLDKIEELIGV